jgi:hypothetical protein
MVGNHLDKIEERLKQNKSVNEADKVELLNLLTTLRTEIDNLSKTHHEHAESIARFAALSTHEATRKEKSSTLFDLSIKGLNSSVQDFEASHPVLAEAVNRFCTLLYNMGI